MIPEIPKAPEGNTAMLLSSETWNAVRDQLIAASAQAGYGMKESGGGEGGTIIDVIPSVFAKMIADLFPTGASGQWEEIYETVSPQHFSQWRPDSAPGSTGDVSFMNFTDGAARPLGG